jgi:flagellar basal body P-ring formation protein FlgA
MINLRVIRNIATKIMALAATCIIPVAAHAVDSGRTIFVPRAVIYPGDKLTDANLIERQLLVSSDNPPVFGERQQDLLGKVARRTLLPGELIPENGIRAQDLVKQGRTYKLSYNSKFLTITGLGVPLQAGSEGEIISVRNPETGIIIKARVQADQTLAVDDR